MNNISKGSKAVLQRNSIITREQIQNELRIIDRVDRINNSNYNFQNLNEEQIEQLICDEITILSCEYYRGGNYFKVLINFWDHYLTNEPFIYFPS